MKKQIVEIDALLRDGRLRAAAAALSRLGGGKPSRAERLTVAKLARRANLPALAMRLLRPLVRPAPRDPVSATDEEKAVYASCLAKVGAVGEALAILEALDADRSPDVSLFRAFAHVARWEYAESIPLLARYARDARIDDYARRIGETNLAAAYVYTRDARRAAPLLEKLRQAKETGAERLRAMALQLSAQEAIGRGDWGAARTFIDEARAVGSGEDALFALFLGKWEAVAELLSGRGAAGALRSIRARAEAMAHWETVRDCDRYLAVGTRDRALLRHVYFGTPYASYREALLRDFPGRPEVPPEHVWQPGRGGKASTVIDLSSGNIAGGRELLPAGHVMHRLLQALSTDFYQPFSVGRLHSILYPEEFFNQSSAPERVKQVAKRLRKALADRRLPLRIRLAGSCYSLDGEGRVGLRVERDAAPVSPYEHKLRDLQRAFTEHTFTVSEAGRILRMPNRTVSRLLRHAEERRSLERTGKGKGTRYRFGRG